MSILNYEKKINIRPGEYEELYLKAKKYEISDLYAHKNVKDKFRQLKANVVDLNPALVTKCIQGTEQDFVMLMNKAKEFLQINFGNDDGLNVILLELFQQCVFGYYKITPLIKANDVSDIHIYAWNRITCKANGERYITDLSFDSEDDYNRWYERLVRIQRLQLTEEAALQHCTDRKGVDDYYLRIDMQLACIVSTEDNNVHFRKIPKEKYSWEYLIKEGMLDEDMITYLQDRIASGYGFMISGKGGSGKSTLLNNMIDLIPFNETILTASIIIE